MNPTLAELLEQKRTLLLESDLNRQVLRVEFGKLRCHFERLRRGYGWAHGAWKWAAPVAGFLFARRFKKTAGVFAKGSLMAGAVRVAWKWWERYRQSKPKPEPGPQI